MKNLLIIIGLSFSLNTFAWFPVNAFCNVNNATARCSVYNHWATPIYCELTGGARTYFGYTLNGYNRGVLAPGMEMWLTINANNPYNDPIVSAYANANCQF